MRAEIAAQQIVEHIKKDEDQLLPEIDCFVIRGNFNTDKENPIFAREATLDTLEEAGFRDVSAGLSHKQRIIHPRRGKYRAAVLDYLFFKGLQLDLKLISHGYVIKSPVSDHWPVLVGFEVQ